MVDRIIYKTDINEMKIEHLYTVEGYATYEVYVRTNGFSGISSMCLPIDIVHKYVLDITIMRDNLEGSICLKDYDSETYIDAGFENSNTFLVKGQLGGSQDTHMLKFEFMADQTLLIGLKANLMQYDH